MSLPPTKGTISGFRYITEEELQATVRELAEAYGWEPDPGQRFRQPQGQRHPTQTDQRN